MLIRAMIVDDEPHILHNLKEVIPWEKLGIEVLALAGNGNEALEQYRKFEPQLILCDIRMPGMDGLEFVKEVRRMDKHCEIIMLTGYKDFEYTRTAIRRGIRDYILKPIDYDELRETVGRIAADIRKRFLREMKEKKKWQRIRDIAYEKVLRDALFGYGSQTIRVLKEDHPELSPDPLYRMMIVDLEHYTKNVWQWEEEERKLWNFAVKNLISDVMKTDAEHVAVLQVRDGEWCVLSEVPAGSTHLSAASLGERAENIRRAVKQHLYLDVKVGISLRKSALDQLSETYKMIQRHMHLTKEREKTDVLYVSPSPSEKDPTDDSLWDAVETMVEGLKQANRERIDRGLDDLNRSLQHISRRSLYRVEQILHYLAVHVLRELKEMQLLDSEQEMWEKLENSKGIKELKASIEEWLTESLAKMNRKKNSDVLMLAAKDYIDRHLNRDIGLSDVSSHLSISPSYFSVLFKQYYRETFLEYVTRKRMEKAKTLLLTSNLSIRKIGEMVGYPERRYFTKVFQKQFGKSPTQLRDEWQR